jgi:hypothetical protein
MSTKKSNTINHQHDQDSDLSIDYKESKKSRNITELPIELIEEVISYLTLKEYFLSFGFCCKSLMQIEIELSNVIYKKFYHRYFPLCNKFANSEVECYKTEFKKRLESPDVGDKIEAMYGGKFKLDCMKEVYKGKYFL